jgi:hypothetical protein
MYQAPEERGQTILSVFKPEKEIYFHALFYHLNVELDVYENLNWKY